MFAMIQDDAGVEIVPIPPVGCCGRTVLLLLHADRIGFIYILPSLSMTMKLHFVTCETTRKDFGCFVFVGRLKYKHHSFFMRRRRVIVDILLYLVPRRNV
jgi:hypothetical protein